MFILIINFIVGVAFILGIVAGITALITKSKSTKQTALVALLIWLFASSISAIIASVN